MDIAWERYQFHQLITIYLLFIVWVSSQFNWDDKLKIHMDKKTKRKKIYVIRVILIIRSRNTDIIIIRMN